MQSSTNIPAVICARVSTRGQAQEGASLETQIEIGNREAERRGAYVAAVFRDEGISGAAYQTRAGIQAGLAMIESGAAKMLIITDVSRAARDVAIASDIRRRVTRAGGTFVFADIGVVDATAASGFNYHIHAAAAQFFREQLREKSISARFQKAKEGEQTSRARAPFGYHIVTKADIIRGSHPASAIGTYEIVEADAAIVREIFTRYNAGDSLRTLCRDLAARGVRGSWTPTKVRRILCATTYRGEAVYGKRAWFEDEARLAQGKSKHGFLLRDEAEWVTIPCPAIVTPAIWEQAATLRAGARKRRGGNPGRVYLLSSLARCPHCGGAVCGATARTPATGLTTPYYRCLRLSCPGYAFIRADSAEALVIGGMVALLRDPAIVERAAVVWQREEPADPQEAEAKAVDAALSRLADKERGAAEAASLALAAGSDPQAFRVVFENITAERKSLAARQASLRGRDKAQSGKAARTVADVLRSVSAEAAAILGDTTGQYPVSVRRAYLGDLVEHITLHRADSGGRMGSPNKPVAVAGEARIGLKQYLSGSLSPLLPAVFLVVTRAADGSICVEVEYR